MNLVVTLTSPPLLAWSAVGGGIPGKLGIRNYGVECFLVRGEVAVEFTVSFIVDREHVDRTDVRGVGVVA